jgi:hypothetical protein
VRERTTVISFKFSFNRKFELTKTGSGQAHTENKSNAAVFADVIYNCGMPRYDPSSGSNSGTGLVAKGDGHLIYANTIFSANNSGTRHAFLEPGYAKNDHFTKTGSGRTSGKLKTEAFYAEMCLSNCVEKLKVRAERGFGLHLV